MITHMHIENFKCFKDFDIDLGPFNVLIGPNDSGKTALLTAIRMLRSRAGSGGHIPTGSADCRWRGEDGVITIRAVAQAREGSGDKQVGEIRSTNGVDFLTPLPAQPTGRTIVGGDAFDECLDRVDCYRLNPIALRKPSRLTAQLGEDGSGFPTFLHDILLKDRDAFSRVEAAIYRRFDYYRGLLIERTTVGTPPRTDHAFVLALRTREGQVLPVGSVSDGVVLSMAFITLCHAPNPPQLLLIEEPENGIHHASLKETIATLQSLSKEKGVQIVLTTHSPYLLDFVQPEDVRVFYKDSEGAAHARKLSDHPDIEKLKKHFMTGEIWTGLEEEDALYSKLGAGQ